MFWDLMVSVFRLFKMIKYRNKYVRSLASTFYSEMKGKYLLPELSVYSEFGLQFFFMYQKSFFMFAIYHDYIPYVELVHVHDIFCCFFSSLLPPFPPPFLHLLIPSPFEKYLSPTSYYQSFSLLRKFKALLRQTYEFWMKELVLDYF